MFKGLGFRVFRVEDLDWGGAGMREHEIGGGP